MCPSVSEWNLDRNEFTILSLTGRISLYVISEDLKIPE
jgi:hypothetical protein